MKTRVMVLVTMASLVAIFLPVFYFGSVTNSNESVKCDIGFIKRGDECFPDTSSLNSNTILIYPIISHNNARISDLSNNFS